MHAGTRLWNYDILDEAKRITNWMLDWCKNKFAHGVVEEQVIECANTLEADIEGWCELLKRFPQHERSKELKSWISSVRADIRKHCK